MAAILTKRSNTASSVPLAADLTNSTSGAELAVNTADKRLFTKDSGGSVQELGTNPSSLTLSGGTVNGLAFLNASKVLTTGSALQFDGSNLGLGVTPSAHLPAGYGGPMLQVGGRASILGSATTSAYTNNTYYAAGFFRYIGNDEATMLEQIDGAFKFYTAPSGTAGNAISFTQAMTLDASGRLGLGITSPSLSFEVGPNAAKGYMHSGVGVFSVGTSTNHPYTFDINGTERARIDSSGTLLVGQTTNPATSTMVIKVPTGSANGVNAQITSNTGTSYPWSNYNASGTYVGGISCTSTGTAFPTSSDYRLKEDVQPMTGALAKVAALKPCTYKWKLNGSDGQGFIAHELAEVVPDAVIGEKDAVDAEGKPVYQGIDTSFLVATLTAAIQELKAEFDAYKASHP